MSDLISVSNTVISNNTGLDAITRAPIVDYVTKYRCLRIQNVSHDEPFTEWGYTEVSEENYKNFQLHKDDIIISRTGGSVGTLKYIDQDYPAVYNNGLIRLIIDKKRYDPKYIYYCLKLDLFKKHIQKCSLGNSTQENIRMNDMLEYKVVDYPLEMQNRIAYILSALDNKIQNNNRIIAELESMAKTIYDYWFLQFEFPNEDGMPYKSSGGKMVWNEELKREIPEGWKIGAFADLLEIGNGKDHKELGDGNIPVYGSGGVMRTVNTFIYNGESVLIPRKGTLNNIIYVNGAFWTVDTMFYTKMKKAHSTIFAYYSVKLYDFEKLNTGTGVPSMTSSIIYNLRVVIPSKEVLESFDNYVQAFYKQMNEKERENRELASLRDFLLPLLMNGQVSF